MSNPQTLSRLVERLRALDAPAIARGAVGELLAGPLDEASLPRLAFHDERYTRHQVVRTELLDVLLLCWRPGQRTPIHNHAGQRGWVRVVRGPIAETSWRVKGQDGIPDLSAFDVDDDGVGHGVVLERTGQAVADAPGVVAVDRVRAIHALGHPDDAGREGALTLHVYSLPHDSCLVFDERVGTVRRRELVFDSRDVLATR